MMFEKIFYWEGEWHPRKRKPYSGRVEETEAVCIEIMLRVWTVF